MQSLLLFSDFKELNLQPNENLKMLKHEVRIKHILMPFFFFCCLLIKFYNKSSYQLVQTYHILLQNYLSYNSIGSSRKTLRPFYLVKTISNLYLFHKVVYLFHKLI